MSAFQKASGAGMTWGTSQDRGTMLNHRDSAMYQPSPRTWSRIDKRLEEALCTEGESFIAIIGALRHSTTSHKTSMLELYIVAA